jgi:NAD+ synthase
VKISLAQLNPIVGDVSGNLSLVRQARDAAAAEGADLRRLSRRPLRRSPPSSRTAPPAVRVSS